MLIGWRDVPVDNSVLGESVKENEPIIRQVLIQRGPETPDTDAFQRKLYVIRKQAHHALWDKNATAWRDFYVVSMSARTMVYKGMVLAPNLAKFYLDFQNSEFQDGNSAVPSAVLDQYVPVVASGAAVPIPVPQWRDQYSSRQHQLDERTSAQHELESARRRLGEVVAGNRR